MRRTGIFFIVFSITLLWVLMLDLVLLGLINHAVAVGAVMVATAIAGWYIDTGSRREYSGRPIRAVDIPIGRYAVIHYNCYETGELLLVIYTGDSLRLCFLKDYFLWCMSYEQAQAGEIGELQVTKRPRETKKFFVCPKAKTN